MPHASTGIEGVAEEVKEPKGFTLCLGEAPGTVEGGGSAGNDVGIGAMVVTMEKHQVVTPVKKAKQGLGIAQPMEVAGFIEGIMGHQKDMLSVSDFGAIKEGLEGLHFEGGDTPAGVPEIEMGASRIKCNGHGIVAHPSDERESRGGGSLWEVTVELVGEKFAMKGNGVASIEVVIAGDGKGSLTGKGENLGEAGSGHREFAFKAKVEGVAGIEEIIHGLALEEFTQAVELLIGLGVLRAATEIEVKKSDKPLGMQEGRCLERARGKRQVDIAEMKDAQTHAGDRSGRGGDGKAGNGKKNRKEGRYLPRLLLFQAAVGLGYDAGHEGCGGDDSGVGCGGTQKRGGDFGGNAAFVTASAGGAVGGQ